MQLLMWYTTLFYTLHHVLGFFPLLLTLLSSSAYTLVFLITWQIVHGGVPQDGTTVKRFYVRTSCVTLVGLLLIALTVFNSLFWEPGMSWIKSTTLSLQMCGSLVLILYCPLPVYEFLIVKRNV